MQNRRKELQCEYTDRIAVGIVTDAEPLKQTVERFGSYIAEETLTAPGRLTTEPIADAEPVELKLAGFTLTLYVSVVPWKP